MKKEVREIKNKLESWGIQKRWLAEKLGVSRALITYWMTGTKDMPDERITEAQEILKEIPEPE